MWSKTSPAVTQEFEQCATAGEESAQREGAMIYAWVSDTTDQLPNSDTK